MVIVTRGLSGKEEKYFEDSINSTPRWDELATDAICVIVNTSSKDTIFTFDRLQKQFKYFVSSTSCWSRVAYGIKSSSECRLYELLLFIH